jgi:hypothetical protein
MSAVDLTDALERYRAALDAVEGLAYGGALDLAQLPQTTDAAVYVLRLPGSANTTESSGRRPYAVRERQALEVHVRYAVQPRNPWATLLQAARIDAQIRRALEWADAAPVRPVWRISTSTPTASGEHLVSIHKFDLEYNWGTP